jgi:SPP1 gp7 family putative phage head morphogenesis protein
VRAVALGQGPQATAYQLRKALGGNLGQYLTIARTEIVGAYRDANTETYQANDDVLSGWEWMTAGDEKVCPFCSDQDGSMHDLDEDINDLTHPNCRCTTLPALK